MHIAAVILDREHAPLAFDPLWVKALVASAHGDHIMSTWACFFKDTLRENLEAARSIGMKAVRIECTLNAEISEPALISSLAALPGLPLPPS
jgi:hypothetical protein